MKDIKNVQEINDIELTEEELDQVQGGIMMPLGFYALAKLIAKNIQVLGQGGGGHRF